MKKLSAKPKDARVVLFDIETSLATGHFFGGIWETNITEVIEQSYMLSFAYKVLGEKETHIFALPDFKGYSKDKTNDEKLVQKLSDILETADLVVGHNIVRFDIATMNARLVAHSLSPPAPFKTLDTLKVARNKFKFPSNKLDDLGDYLGVGRKRPHTGKHLWMACMKGDKDAWEEMRKYNIQDVVLLERVYKKLSPWATNHPNVNINTRKMDACPHCGSTMLEKRGYRYTRTAECQRYQCLVCHAWSSGQLETIASKVLIR